MATAPGSDFFKKKPPHDRSNERVSLASIDFHVSQEGNQLTLQNDGLEIRAFVTEDVAEPSLRSIDYLGGSVSNAPLIPLSIRDGPLSKDAWNKAYNKTGQYESIYNELWNFCKPYLEFGPAPGGATKLYREHPNTGKGQGVVQLSKARLIAKFGTTTQGRIAQTWYNHDQWMMGTKQGGWNYSSVPRRANIKEIWYEACKADSSLLTGEIRGMAVRLKTTGRTVTDMLHTEIGYSLIMNHLVPDLASFIQHDYNLAKYSDFDFVHETVEELEEFKLMRNMDQWADVTQLAGVWQILVTWTPDLLKLVQKKILQTKDQAVASLTRPLWTYESFTDRFTVERSLTEDLVADSRTLQSIAGSLDLISSAIKDSYIIKDVLKSRVDIDGLAAFKQDLKDQVLDAIEPLVEQYITPHLQSVSIKATATETKEYLDAQDNEDLDEIAEVTEDNASKMKYFKSSMSFNVAFVDGKAKQEAALTAALEKSKQLAQIYSTKGSSNAPASKENPLPSGPPVSYAKIVESSAQEMDAELDKFDSDTLTTICGSIDELDKDLLTHTRASCLFDLVDAERAYKRYQNLVTFASSHFPDDPQSTKKLRLLGKVVLALSILLQRTTVVHLYMVSELEDILLGLQENDIGFRRRVMNDLCSLFSEMQTALEAVYLFATCGSTRGWSLKQKNWRYSNDGEKYEAQNANPAYIIFDLITRNFFCGYAGCKRRIVEDLSVYKDRKSDRCGSTHVYSSRIGDRSIVNSLTEDFHEWQPWYPCPASALCSPFVGGIACALVAVCFQGHLSHKALRGKSRSFGKRKADDLVEDNSASKRARLAE